MRLLRGKLAIILTGENEEKWAFSTIEIGSGTHDSEMIQHTQSWKETSSIPTQCFQTERLRKVPFPESPIEFIATLGPESSCPGAQSQICVPSDSYDYSGKDSWDQHVCIHSCVCVLTCLSDVSIRMDPSSNARAMGMFVEAVEGGNKVVIGNVLKQNTSWTWILRSRSWRKTWMRFFRQITINKILVGN